MLTMPTTPKRTAKVQSGRGVKIKNRYFWSAIFRNPKIEETQVQVRYDPFNAGIGYAYVLGQWVECYSEHYNGFLNCSEKELMLATAELHKRQTLHSRQFSVTATNLASFLESMEAEEVLLRQRATDREQRNILALIDGGNKSQSIEVIPNPTPSIPNAPIHASSLQSSSIDKPIEVIRPELYGELK